MSAKRKMTYEESLVWCGCPSCAQELKEREAAHLQRTAERLPLLAPLILDQSTQLTETT